VQTRQLDGGNNTGAMMVTMLMQHEDKEVSKIMTIMLMQQGRQHHAMLVMVPAQQGRPRHHDIGKDACASMMAMMPL
jgi:hypothetical protein